MTCFPLLQHSFSQIHTHARTHTHIHAHTHTHTQELVEWDGLDRLSMACPALPLCGLAVTEAERALPDVNTRIRAMLTRVSGCACVDVCVHACVWAAGAAGSMGEHGGL